jgi:hypothetical protein
MTAAKVRSQSIAVSEAGGLDRRRIGRSAGFLVLHEADELTADRLTIEKVELVALFFQQATDIVHSRRFAGLGDLKSALDGGHIGLHA